MICCGFHLGLHLMLTECITESLTQLFSLLCPSYPLYYSCSADYHSGHIDLIWVLRLTKRLTKRR